jgi:predicted transcriptional regulator
MDAYRFTTTTEGKGHVVRRLRDDGSYISVEVSNVSAIEKNAQERTSSDEMSEIEQAHMEIPSDDELERKRRWLSEQNDELARNTPKTYSREDVRTAVREVLGGQWKDVEAYVTAILSRLTKEAQHDQR